MSYSEIVDMLSGKGLKVTPQRLAVLEALMTIKDHPTADAVKEYVRRSNPNLAIGTIYNILETFCEKGIIKKIKTDKDFMQYDIEMHKHHHLYCEGCDQVVNYFDEELDELLQGYFERKQIPDFTIKEINLQIIGNYKNHKPTKNS